MELEQALNLTDPQCISRQMVNIIADKWSVLVIYRLSLGVKRYGQLQREIGGISQKMLTQTLRLLEHNGLVRREVYPVVPPKVEYELTPLGETLIEPVIAICLWAERHRQEILAARAQPVVAGSPAED